MDNYATHKHPKWRHGLKSVPAITCTSPPTSASWINQVERWFAKITQERIRRSAFHSVAELERAILDYIEENNRDPKPFVWTATADLILGKVRAVCERINHSGH